MTTTVESCRTASEASGPYVTSEFIRGGDLLARELVVGDARLMAGVHVEPGLRDLLAWWRAYWSGQIPAADRERGTLRLMELFSGAGGLALGFRQAASELGYDVSSVIAADQDSEALDVYARHNETRHVLPCSVSELIDYRVKGRGSTAAFRYDPAPLGPVMRNAAEKVDVLLAGPPCQGHSDLNNHSRGTDRRNELYLTVPAVALALNVPTVIIENVPGIVRDSRGVVETTKALLRRAGYEITSGTLKADDFGWPQTRKRFFLVATKAHEPVELATVAAALARSPNKPALSVLEALEGFSSRSPDNHMWRTPEVSPETQSRLDWLFDNDAYDLDLSERPDCHREGTSYMSVYGRMRPDEPAPTITTGFLTMGRGRFVHPVERRVITPAEAARLQGFPDDYDFTLADGSSPSSLKLTKWIGDAVPMPLGHAATLAALLPRVVADDSV